jgi:hypothetical protein
VMYNTELNKVISIFALHSLEQRNILSSFSYPRFRLLLMLLDERFYHLVSCAVSQVPFERKLVRLVAEYDISSGV